MSGHSPSLSGGGGGGATGGSSSSRGGASDATIRGNFRELNTLKAELKELRGKVSARGRRAEGGTDQYAHAQSMLAAAASPPSDAAATEPTPSAATSSAAAANGATRHTDADYLKLQQSNHALQSQTQSLQSALQSQTEELATARAENSSLSRNLSEKESQVDALLKELSSSRGEVTTLQGDRVESGSLVEKLSLTITGYEQKLESQEARILGMEVEFKHLKTLQTEKAELEVLVEKLRTLLFATTKESSRKNQELINALQATRQFLEELKAEYESYAVNTRVEHDLYKRSKGKELQELREKYDALKLNHYEASQELHNDQIEIIETLQSNYLEYRLMVENLFYSEARSLEDKLQQQQLKYESEIKYILRTKDMHFHDMVTSKDAKIMNLIEGTDSSKILIQHQMELEALKKKHEREVDLVKEAAGQENKKLVMQLKKEIVDKAAEIDKYHTQILTWEKKLEQTLALLKKQKKLHAMKEDSSEKNAKEVQLQLSKAYTQIESLIQVKENLRHRILRLRLQIEGTADDSVPSIIKRLSKETKRLSTDLGMLSFNYKSKSDAHEQLQKAHEKLGKQVDNLEQELSHRSKEYKALTQTYESFLSHRLRGGVAGAGRVSMYDPAVTKVLNEVSGPFLQALFKHKEFGMKETLLRATSARSDQQQTMLALRLGAPEPFGHGPDEKVDPMTGHISAAAPRPGSEYSVSHLDGGGKTKRRTVVLDGTSSMGHLPTDRFTGLHSARSTADFESSVVVQPNAPSQRVSRASSIIDHVALPSAAAFSTRGTPLPIGLSPMAPSPSHSHTRHVSINQPIPLQPKYPPSSGTSPIPDFDLHVQEVQYHSQLIQHQQQQQQYPSSHHHAHHPSTTSSMYASDDRPGSRSSRLHDLIKSTASIAMPDQVRRVPEPKSIRERDRRAAAATAPIVHHAEPPPVEEPRYDEHGRLLKKKKSRVHAYKKPAALVDLESQAELVDLASIRQLERGFNMLERFKATSAAFEADARGRLRREVKEERPRGLALGAFARTEAPAVDAQSEWDRQAAEDDARANAAALQDVSHHVTRVYTGASSSAGAVYGMTDSALDDYGDSAPLQLDLTRYGDSVAVTDQDGEAARLYHPVSSAVPWWSSAAGSLMPMPRADDHAGQPTVPLAQQEATVQPPKRP